MEKDKGVGLRGKKRTPTPQSTCQKVSLQGTREKKRGLPAKISKIPPLSAKLLIYLRRKIGLFKKFSILPNLSQAAKPSLTSHKVFTRPVPAQRILSPLSAKKIR